MRIWLHKIEVIVDRLIPLVLALLLVVIIGELFFSHQFEWYSGYADWFDSFIVVVFATDLGFKYSRIRKFPNFFRKYWLEIIATIPFFMVFRLLELFKVPEFIERSQLLAHEAPVAQGVEREAAALVKETARAGEVSRVDRMLNVFRAFGRSPRFIKALHFFEKPIWRHDEPVRPRKRKGR